MKRILIIVGTRPEAIKLLPVYRALKSDDTFSPVLVVTGQHGEAMMDPLFNFFEIKPDISLHLMKSKQSLNEFAGLLMLELDKVFATFNPDLVVVQGDTTSCMVGSMAAFYRQIKIAHIEAGLRTYNRNSPYPEEINRRITSLITDIHFAPTEGARKNLERENIEGQIQVVGNTVIDSLLDACERIDKEELRYQQKFEYITGNHERIILITGHRRENIGSNFREIYSAILKLATQYPQFAFVYPLHTNPSVRELAFEMLSQTKNVFLIDSLPYDEMIYWIKKSYLVLTDSGGIQEECPSLNKPVMVLRDTTERPEGIEAGCSILAGITQSSIVETFNKIVNDEKRYHRMSCAQNPYGNGNSSFLILTFLKRYFNIL